LRFTRAVRRNPGKLRGYAADRRLELVDALEPVLADPEIDTGPDRARAAAQRRRAAAFELPSVDSFRANLEAFADAVAGRAFYPILPSEMLDTVATFEATAEAVRQV
jgi:hypothetical protein